MILVEKIKCLILVFRKSILNFQSDQVEKIIGKIRELSACIQMYIAFSIIYLYKFFATLPQKIKIKLDLIPSKKLDDESPHNIPYTNFNNYSDYIPFYQKRILASDQYFFRI